MLRKSDSFEKSGKDFEMVLESWRINRVIYGNIPGKGYIMTKKHKQTKPKIDNGALCGKY